MPNFKSTAPNTAKKSPENWIDAKMARAITYVEGGQTQKKIELICITSRQTYILN